jgi:hypothetical protein
MKKGPLSLFLIFFLFFPGSSLLGSQDIPVRRRALSESWLRLLADEVNGYAAFNNLAVISTYHRTLGSDETHDILLRLKKKCEDYALTSTEILRVPVKTGYEFFGLQNFDGQVPTRVRRAELRLVKPFPKLITTAESAPSSLIQGSRSADLTAPVVFIGRGDDPKNYEAKMYKRRPSTDSAPPGSCSTSLFRPTAVTIRTPITTCIGPLGERTERRQPSASRSPITNTSS